MQVVVFPCSGGPGAASRPAPLVVHVTDGRGSLVLGMTVNVPGVSEVMVVWVFMARVRGSRRLGWELRYPSWRQGFRHECA